MGLCITCPALSLQLRVNTSSSNSHHQVSSRGWYWNLLTPHWVLSHSGSCWGELRLYIWWPVSSSLFLSPDLQILKEWFPGRKERGNSSEGFGFNPFSSYLHHASNLTREWGAGSERTPYANTAMNWSVVQTRRATSSLSCDFFWPFPHKLLLKAKL